MRTLVSTITIHLLNCSIQINTYSGVPLFWPAIQCVGIYLTKKRPREYIQILVGGCWLVDWLSANIWLPSLWEEYTFLPFEPRIGHVTCLSAPPHPQTWAGHMCHFPSDALQCVSCHLLFSLCYTVLQISDNGRSISLAPGAELTQGRAVAESNGNASWARSKPFLCSVTKIWNINYSCLT